MHSRSAPENRGCDYIDKLNPFTHKCVKQCAFGAQGQFPKKSPMERDECEISEAADSLETVSATTNFYNQSNFAEFHFAE